MKSMRSVTFKRKRKRGGGVAGLQAWMDHSESHLAKNGQCSYKCSLEENHLCNIGFDSHLQSSSSVIVEHAIYK